MKKRTTFSILILTCLLVVAFISGSVFAQGDITSREGGSSGTQASYPMDETAPGLPVQASVGVSFSSSDGISVNKMTASADESAFEAGVPATSSSSDAQADGANGGTIKFEPLVAMETDAPNAPTWSSTVRFVGSTLKPRANDVNYRSSADGGCVYVTSGNSGTVWNLPISFPQGTRVEWLRMYYVDNDPANATAGWFTKYDLYGGLVQEWSITSSDGGAGYRDVLITPTQTIDYNLYSYVINWRPVGTGENVQLCGFRLYYTGLGFNFIPWISKH